MKLTTAGESHGKALVAIVEGLPAHLRIDKNQIDKALSRRQGGFGRGARQTIERDCVEILTGVRNGETLGSPLTLCIYNKDFENWSEAMSAGECDQAATDEKKLTKVRPGHADLTGMLKFGQTDARNILERASARETAIRAAAGELYRMYLSALGVEITGSVVEVCGIQEGNCGDFQRIVEEKITALKEAGDTAGGVVEIRVRGLKGGFGSMMTYAEKLDACLAQGLMSIQAVKGVEFGLGFQAARKKGSEVHDEIFYDETRGFYRNSNHAGGIEGGMSNGEEIVIRVAMKPIPTLMKGLKTVDFESKEESTAATERGDVCAIYALEVVAEAVVAQVLADAVAKRLGGDTMEQVEKRYNELP